MEIVITALGGERMYTRDSYKEAHGGRSPEDDGLKGEQCTFADGSSKEVFKAHVVRSPWWGLSARQTVFFLGGGLHG